VGKKNLGFGCLPNMKNAWQCISLNKVLFCLIRPSIKGFDRSSINQTRSGLKWVTCVSKKVCFTFI
jgi:hypothetical protein